MRKKEKNRTVATFMLTTSVGVMAFVAMGALKTLGVIGWSWWVVTSPLWGLAAVEVLLPLVGTIIILTNAIISGRRKGD